MGGESSPEGEGAQARIDVRGLNSQHDYEVVLADHDDIALTLRALLNDADGSVGLALVLDAVREVLQSWELRIAEVVLTSGCRLHSVNQVASALQVDRGTLRGRLGSHRGITPKAVVRFVRATYAAFLLRCTSLSIGQVAARIRYSAGRHVQGSLYSEFGFSARELKTRFAGLSAEAYLSELADHWYWRRVNRAGLKVRGQSRSVVADSPTG